MATKRMTLTLDGDVAAALLELHGQSKAKAAREGTEAPTLGRIASDLLTAGLGKPKKRSR